MFVKPSNVSATPNPAAAFCPVRETPQERSNESKTLPDGRVLISRCWRVVEVTVILSSA